MNKITKSDDNILDKSFINENSKDIQDNINNQDLQLNDSKQYLSSVYGMISSYIPGRLNDDNESFPSSNELNIFDSIESKYYRRAFFYREVSRTLCEISYEDNKKLYEKIMMYYKGNSLQLEPNKIHDNLEDTIELSEDLSELKNFEVDSFVKFERILNKNKSKHANSTPFYFNILVLGKLDIGKTTLIKILLKKFDECKKNTNSSFIKEGDDFLIMSEINYPTLQTEEPISDESIYNSNKTLTFKTYERKFSKNYFKIIDTPGYLTNVNSEEWIYDIIKFIESTYNDHKINEKDNRIHLCLYLTEGSEIDYKYMKKISDITNIIPIIAKGEKYPLDQMIKIKSSMVEKLNEYKIITYNVESAISELCNDQIYINILTGGSLGFCPPYMIGIGVKTDITRLFMALTCYIPFDCVEKCGIYYQNYLIKNNNLKHKNENIISKNYMGLILACVGAGIGSGYICYKYNNKK